MAPLDAGVENEPPPSPDTTDAHQDPTELGEAVEYSADTDTYRASFDSDTESVCRVVISTVAVVSETEPTELPPLYSVVNPDALEKLVDSTDGESSSSDFRVSFGFDGHTVTVHSHGVVAVQPPQANGDTAVGEPETG